MHIHYYHCMGKASSFYNDNEHGPKVLGMMVKKARKIRAEMIVIVALSYF